MKVIFNESSSHSTPKAQGGRFGLSEQLQFTDKEDLLMKANDSGDGCSSDIQTRGGSLADETTARSNDRIRSRRTHINNIEQFAAILWVNYPKRRR